MMDWDDLPKIPTKGNWHGQSGTWYVAGVVSDVTASNAAYSDPPRNIDVTRYDALSVAWHPEDGGEDKFRHIYGPFMDLESLADIIEQVMQEVSP